jgi:hypothetical protein
MSRRDYVIAEYAASLPQGVNIRCMSLTIHSSGHTARAAKFGR